jgi:hypothetical protein
MDCRYLKHRDNEPAIYSPFLEGKGCKLLCQTIVGTDTWRYFMDGEAFPHRCMFNFIDHRFIDRCGKTITLCG